MRYKYKIFRFWIKNLDTSNLENELILTESVFGWLDVPGQIIGPGGSTGPWYRLYRTVICLFEMYKAAVFRWENIKEITLNKIHPVLLSFFDWMTYYNRQSQLSEWRHQ